MSTPQILDRFPGEHTRIFRRRLTVTVTDHLKDEEAFVSMMKRRTVIAALLTAALVGFTAPPYGVFFVAFVLGLAALVMGVFAHLDGHLAAARSRASRLVRLMDSRH